jgi:hypothetical protein
MSCLFLDPSLLLYDINEYRMEKHMRYMLFSDYLNKLSRIHVQDILANRVPFSLENNIIRRNKLSSTVKTCQEILLRCHENKNILQTLLNEPGTKNIIENGYNICGITMFQIGEHIHVHGIFCETF